MVDKQVIERVERELIAQGRIIEAGWQGLRLMAVPPGAPEIQLREMRKAFFAGAQHLFSTIMRTLDPGDEPTEADMRRLDNIQAELDAFIKDFEAQHLVTGGGA